ncbi:MAG: hypothetical protein AAFQ94_13590 [Bacteroidota bacterium]
MSEKKESVPLLGFYFLAASPFIAVGSWIVFRKFSKFNIWKYLIASIFLLGHIRFFWILMRILFFVFPVLKEHTYIFIILNAFYILYGIYSLHIRFAKRKAYIFFLTFLAMLVTLIFGSIVLGIAGGYYASRG